jgi:hypothetical protein
MQHCSFDSRPGHGFAAWDFLKLVLFEVSLENFCPAQCGSHPNIEVWCGQDQTSLSLEGNTDRVSFRLRVD